MPKVITPIKIFILSCFFVCGLHSQNETVEKFTIELETAEKIYDFYIGKLQVNHTALPLDWIHVLEETLLKDLHFSAKINLVKRSDELETLLREKHGEEAFSHAAWADKASYIIRPQVIDQTLHLEVFDVANKLMLSFKDIHLNGIEESDIRTIHKLSDLLLERLLGEIGIADSKILYTRTIPNHDLPKQQWVSEIWEVDCDGKHPKKLIANQSYNLTPAYFPHRKGNFLYVSYRYGQPKIFFASPNEQPIAPLILLRGNQLLPSISPKGDKIAFISDAAGRPDVFLQNYDSKKGPVGKPLQIYSYPRSVNASPTFSPDSMQIAFVSDKDQTPRIYLLALGNSDQNHAICLTLKNRENTAPNWSPDGRKIAYSAKTDGIRQIWIYDFDLKEEMQVTSGPMHKENPCFAPDSLHIVYNTTGDKSDLYVVDLIQRSPVKITSGSDINHYPAWEPK